MLSDVQIGNEVVEEVAPELAEYGSYCRRQVEETDLNRCEQVWRWVEEFRDSRYYSDSPHLMAEKENCGQS